MLGRGHRFLGITSTFWGVNVSSSRTQHGLTRVGLEPPTFSHEVAHIIKVMNSKQVDVLTVNTLKFLENDFNFVEWGLQLKIFQYLQLSQI